MENVLTVEEKKAYVERIEKKARDENVTIKHAAQKLGCKVWSYYKYKADVKRLDTNRSGLKTDTVQNGTMEKHGPPMPISITFNIAPDVAAYLEKEANGYATEPDLVAQLLLHDCVRGKMVKTKET